MAIIGSRFCVKHLDKSINIKTINKGRNIFIPLVMKVMNIDCNKQRLENIFSLKNQLYLSVYFGRSVDEDEIDDIFISELNEDKNCIVKKSNNLELTYDEYLWVYRIALEAMYYSKVNQKNYKDYHDIE